MPTLTVQEIIDILNTVENKKLPVFIYNSGDLLNISHIDTELLDRIDLNAEEVN